LQRPLLLCTHSTANILSILISLMQLTSFCFNHQFYSNYVPHKKVTLPFRYPTYQTSSGEISHATWSEIKEGCVSCQKQSLNTHHNYSIVLKALWHSSRSSMTLLVFLKSGAIKVQRPINWTHDKAGNNHCNEMPLEKKWFNGLV
jgi:hypothetical protein